MRLSNKYKPNWLVILLVLINLTVIGSVWFTKPKPGDKALTRMMVNRLNFDEDQAKAYREERSQHVITSKRLFSQETALRLELLEATFQNDRDTSEINQILVKMETLRKKLDWNRIDHLSKVFEICKPEQRRLLHEIMTEGALRPKEGR